ncbi:MAG: rubrerythrin [Rikenellaceae bacterium]
MKNLQGTATEQNLLKAFAGEGQARNRYTYYASVAKKEGYEQIAAIFAETADQEKEHAERFFKHLVGGQEVSITASFPAGMIRTTPENLLAAAEGEHEEGEVLYPEFARIAFEEGFPEIAETFRQVCVAEKEHERRYFMLLARIGSGNFFKRDDEIIWQCRNCGFITDFTTDAPDICPACKHAQAYFEPRRENY